MKQILLITVFVLLFIVLDQAQAMKNLVKYSKEQDKMISELFTKCKK